MAEISGSGVSFDQVTQMIADAIAGLPITFVNGGSAMTIDALMTSYPPGVAYMNKFAQVSNLYNGTSLTAAGGINDTVKCRFDVANNVYRWVPQREAFNIAMAPVSGTTTLAPLVAPPTVRLTGTLVGNLTVTPSATNAYIGQKFTIIQNSTLGLFVTSIAGLVGSNLTLLGNNTQELEFTNIGWVKSIP